MSEKELQERQLDEDLLECPNSFDKVKWSIMTRKEKQKYLNISDKEWNRMVREHQLQRMAKAGKDFHFYALKDPV